MKKFILTIMACVGMLSANAQEVTITNIYYEDGKDGSFDICIKSEEDSYSAYQMYLYVPAGTVFPTKRGVVNADAALSDGAICAINENSVAYTFVLNGGSAEPITGFDQYLITAYDKDNFPFATKGEGGAILTVNYLASTVGKMKVYLKHIVLATPTGGKDVVEEVESTGITGIAADKAEAANDGKFVENNRVVIKKAGVKYSTTGQVVK